LQPRAVMLALCLLLTCAPHPGVAEGRSAGITRTDQLPTAELRSWRKQLIAGQTLRASKLRGLADALDGLAAFAYAKRLEDIGDPDVLPDAAHYYSIAAYTGRDFAVNRLVKLVQDPAVVLTASQQKGALDALIRRGKAGNANAALALGRMYEAGHPFGKDAVAARVWLQVAADAGNEDAALKLALQAMVPAPGAPADPDLARRVLSMLAASDNPGKKAMAGTLLARLDRTEPPQAQGATP